MSKSARVGIAMLAAVVLAIASYFASARTNDAREIKAVVVAMFERGNAEGDDPGEFQYWVEREGLTQEIPFPQGYQSLRMNDDGVLAIVAGIGTARAASSIMALGLDPRFDLTKAYWLVAGISGVDPADMSLGSAAWAEWVVDGDLSHTIDIREAPDDWSTGRIPLRKTSPFELPLKSPDEGEVYHLNAGLVNWAFDLTRDVRLDDTEGLRERRSLFEGFPSAQRPPFVLKGDNLAAMNYFHGRLLTEWANEWVEYWTEGQGNFVTSAMEDTGFMQALTFLDNAGRVDRERAMVLRATSNFSMQWPGGTAIESLAGEKIGEYSAYLPALEAAYRVGSTVVDEITENWDRYRDTIPGS